MRSMNVEEIRGVVPPPFWAQITFCEECGVDAMSTDADGYAVLSGQYKGRFRIPKGIARVQHGEERCEECLIEAAIYMAECRAEGV